MPRLRLAAAVALLLPLAALPGAAQDTQDVFVVNLPEVQQVEGVVSLAGPTPQTRLVAVREAIVAPVAPAETGSLVDGGRINAEGFVSVVLSLAGRMRADHFAAGRVGAILLPDESQIRTAFEEDGRLLFPLEAAAEVTAGADAYFSSPQQAHRLGFPRYRVYFWNTTDRPAEVTLYAYLAN